MSAETDLKVFREELEGVIKDAHGAVDTIVEKLDKYLEKLGSSPDSVTPLRATSDPDTKPSPEPPSLSATLAKKS
jgi:hypothetical protein